jgi:tetratricopeptide (TPR) repeat protein
MIARILTACLVVAALAGSAHAADKRVAAAHFQKGRALFESGAFQAALDEFNAGYDAYPLAGFLVNIGQCQRKLDHLDEAATSFQKFLDSNPGDGKLRGEVQEALAEISSERDRRAAAEVEARRQRDDAERRHPLEEEQRADLRPREPAHPAVASAALSTSAPVASVEQQPQKSRKWVWAVVSVIAVGAAASAIAVGVVETQPSSARPGSLGLLDGRR